LDYSHLYKSLLLKVELKVPVLEYRCVVDVCDIAKHCIQLSIGKNAQTKKRPHPSGGEVVGMHHGGMT
jgi:hypothetical protein